MNRRPLTERTGAGTAWSRSLLMLLMMLTLLMPAVCAGQSQPPVAPEVGAPDAAAPPEADAARGRGLKWTGISLLSAGGAFALGSFTFNDSKGCGFFNELACRDVGRVYGSVSAASIVTGLVLLELDRRKQRAYERARPAPATARLAISPRGVHMTVQF